MTDRAGVHVWAGHKGNHVMHMTGMLGGVHIFFFINVIDVTAQATDEPETRTDLELLQTAQTRVDWHGEHLFGIVRRAVERAATAKSLLCRP